MVTNSPSNGAGGIIYKFVAVPEPTGMMMFGVGALALRRLKRA